MRLESHVGPVRTQMTNTQKMNKYEMSTQKNPNSHVYYFDKSKSKSINRHRGTRDKRTPQGPTGTWVQA